MNVKGFDICSLSREIKAMGFEILDVEQTMFGEIKYLRILNKEEGTVAIYKSIEEGLFEQVYNIEPLGNVICKKEDYSESMMEISFQIYLHNCQFHEEE